MYILAIETTGPFGSVALVSEEEKKCVVLGEMTSTDEMNHLKDLLQAWQKPNCPTSRFPQDRVLSQGSVSACPLRVHWGRLWESHVSAYLLWTGSAGKRMCAWDMKGPLPSES